MLARKVVTRSGRGFRGNFPSKKLNRMVQFESILERDAIKWFDSDPEVVSFQEQPTIIFYLDEMGESRKYFPDFELKLKSGLLIHVEVKPEARMAEMKNQQKFQSISENYRNRKEIFVILTCAYLHREPKRSIAEIVQNTCVEET